DVGGVAVVDDPVGAVRGRLADAVVHEVAGELGCGPGAIGQTPDDAPAVAGGVDLDNADRVDGVGLHIAEEFAGTGGDEVLAGQVIGLDPHLDPLPRGLVKPGAAGGHILPGHAVGQVAAVALVPARQIGRG